MQQSPESKEPMGVLIIEAWDPSRQCVQRSEYRCDLGNHEARKCKHRMDILRIIVRDEVAKRRQVQVLGNRCTLDQFQLPMWLLSRGMQSKYRQKALHQEIV